MRTEPSTAYNEPPRWWQVCFATAQGGAAQLLEGDGNDLARWCWIGVMAFKEGLVRFLETRERAEEPTDAVAELTAIAVEAPVVDLADVVAECRRLRRRPSGITLL
jgi:hypothetical protein